MLLRCSASFSVRCLFTSSRLISHPFIRLSVLGLLFVSFRPSLLRSHSRSTSAYFRFRFRLFPFFSAFFRPLLFRFRLLSLPFLPFLFFPALPHGGSSGAQISLSVLLFFFRSLRLISHSVFPVLSTQFLLVSFRSTLLRSRSCFTGDHLLLPFVSSALLSVLFLGFRFLSSTSALGLQLLSLCFFRSFFIPVFASQWLFRFGSSALASSLFPFSSPWFPVVLFRFFCTWLPARFLSSFPVSLPQLFHRCFPFGSLLRDQRLTSASFRPLPF